MTWDEYVRRVIGDDRQVDVAQKTGIDQTTISRWLSSDPAKSRRLSSQSVAAFARGYGLSVIEAFVVAGFLTPDEAGMKSGLPDLSKLTKRELIDELDRRMSS